MLATRFCAEDSSLRASIISVFIKGLLPGQSRERLRSFHRAAWSWFPVIVRRNMLPPRFGDLVVSQLNSGQLMPVEFFTMEACVFFSPFLDCIPHFNVVHPDHCCMAQLGEHERQPPAITVGFRPHRRHIHFCLGHQLAIYPVQFLF